MSPVRNSSPIGPSGAPSAGVISNGMRILQVSADRSKRGILFPGTPAFKRQEAYAKRLGNLDIIAFTLPSDDAEFIDAGALRIFPTNAPLRLLQAFAARHIAKSLQKPAVISAQDPFETGFVAYLLARSQGVPLHVQVHTDLLSPAYAAHSFLNKIRVHIAKFVLSRAKRIRVVSERIKSSLEEKWKIRAPITVLPIFVEKETNPGAQRFDLWKRFQGYTSRVLVVARLEPEKNVALAITSFAASAPRDACLIVVGRGSERERLAALASTLGVSNRIFFEGEHDAHAYISLSDLVIVPSEYEGYGLIIIDALRRGKPVLSTDVGIAKDAGAIVAKPENFSEALKEWFKNGPRVGKLQKYPYENFEQYVEAYCDDVLATAESRV